jgi:hypothetical protein
LNIFTTPQRQKMLKLPTTTRAKPTWRFCAGVMPKHWEVQVWDMPGA